MKQRILPPIRESKSAVDLLELYILKLLRKEMYFPLLKIINLPKLTLIKNASNQSYVVASLQQGQIRYEGNRFSGVFTAASSKELLDLGAKWSRNPPGWVIEHSLLPIHIQEGIRGTKQAEEALKAKLTAKLDTIDPSRIAGGLKADKVFLKATKHVETEFQRSVKSLMIAPQISQQAKAKIAEDYSTNLKKYITDFTQEQILKLREQVETHTFEGNRYKELSEYIKQSYGVSQRKAKFLARQETNLLTSKVKETRYADVGIDEYEWRCVSGTSEHPVRPMHLKLNKTIQRFSDPPITDKSGRRNNPGEDFNCRCSAHPIVKF